MISITKDTYSFYKRIFEIIWQFQAQHAHIDPAIDYSPIKVLESWEIKSMSLARRGLKEGLLDTLSQMSYLSNEYKNEISILLEAENFPPLNILISKVKDIPKKVLKRGKIKNLDEFYVVKEICDDLSYEIADNDRKELNVLLGVFENNYKEPKKSNKR